MYYYEGIRRPQWVLLPCPEALVEADKFTASFLNLSLEGCLRRHTDHASLVAHPIIQHQESSPPGKPK